MRWRYTDCGDEEACAGFYDDFDKFVELSFRIIVTGLRASVTVFSSESMDHRRRECGEIHFVFLALPPTCGSSRSTPNGAFLSARNPFSSAICSLNMSGV